MNKLIWFSLWFCLCSASVFAQTNTGLKEKFFPVNDTIRLDTLSIVPNSVIIRTADGNIYPDSLYLIVPASSKIVWKKAPPEDSIWVSYRTFSVDFSKPQFHKDSRIIQKRSTMKTDPFAFSASDKIVEPVTFNSLNKNGSISRGINFGNARDLGVSSSLDLQLSGMIADDVELSAVIADDNIPIQPEGNTQQIQDFDKVFIKLKKQENTLTLGDFELRKPDSYFMNFNKKLKGVYATTEQNISNKLKLKAGLSGAIAKGKYTKISFTGTEGNQGPYRLKGVNAELFIIILSGTERIYINGELLKRGADYDYVIDYNTAELTFTSKRVINRNSRIVAEYEYSDKNYSRSLVYANTELESTRLKLKFNFYNEQDNKNQPLLQGLNENQQLFLSGIGDSLKQAMYPNNKLVEFNADQILYRKIDTLGYTNVFVYTALQDTSLYQVGFSLLGQGKGNYRQRINTAANGRVFDWVEPIAGIPQGEYEPVTLLVTPKRNQLFTVGASYQLTKNTRLGSELAISNNDVNLYSYKDKSDNKGFAYKGTLENIQQLSTRDSGDLRLITGLNYEIVAKNFEPIERYRAVEFERNFNLGNTAQKQYEYLAGFSIGLNNKELRKINYYFNTFIREKVYKGFRNGFDADLRYKTYHLKYDASLLTSEAATIKGNYIKQKLDVSKEFKYFMPGFALEQENNRLIIPGPDSLLSSSFAFDQWQVYIQNPTNWTNHYRLDHSRRFDYLPLGNGFRRSTIADVTNFQAEYLENQNSVLTFNGTRRVLKVQNASSGIIDEENIIGRVQYDARIAKGVIRSSTYYELGAGQEPKREFNYLRVENGFGVYQWNDYNKNTIPELNEFAIAFYKDSANYIRVINPGNTQLKTRSNGFNEVLNIDPYGNWNSKAGIRKFLSRFSNQTALKLERKVLYSGKLDFLNPFTTRLADTTLVSSNNFFSNTFSFNRANPVYGIDFSSQQGNTKILLLSGFDTRSNSEKSLRLRWNFITDAGLVLSGKTGGKQFTSELSLMNNYNIAYNSIAPELSWQISGSWRLIGTYQLEQQQNSPQFGNEKLIHRETGAELQYLSPGKGSVSAKTNYILNNFQGLSNTPIAYEMLQGLQVGKNYVWEVLWQRNIGSNFQLGFTYQGRKSEDAKAIHSGGMQARANF